MGISVQELLAQDFFRDFYVLAGSRGLGKEIQGITVLEAPDAFHWTQGKEMVLSSGYVIAKEPGCIAQSFREGSMQKCSAFVIKRDRYLEQVPEEMVKLFDQYDVPLLSMPFSVPWMDIMSEVNTVVMNRTIRRFRMNSSAVYQISSLTYKEQKIRKILQAVEAEMKFPAFLYDFAEKKSYYSSANFRRIADSFGLSDEDFWEPSRPYTKHRLCDYIQMTRYRLVEQQAENLPRVSWIRIPIRVNENVQAYFAVMESRELLDYYDQFAIRIAFLSMQGLYEQIVVAQDMGNIGFENFVLYVLNSASENPKKVMFQANLQGLSTSRKYVYVMFRQKPGPEKVSGCREGILGTFRKGSMYKCGKIAITGQNEGLIFIEAPETGTYEKEEVTGYLREFRERVKEKCDGLELEFGILLEPDTLLNLRECSRRCRKALEMGSQMQPGGCFWDYAQLGPLAWLEIPGEELQHMLERYKNLMKEKKNVELLRTLKVYLENNMNFSATADKMYVHINTIRKRIDKINDLLNIDWDNSLERMNTSLLLQFLELDSSE